MSKTIEVLLPDIGDFHDVEIIEVLVAPGDSVAVEDPLITLESDKASMDIPSPSQGVVRDLKVKLGDKLNEGDLIALLETDTNDVDSASETAQAPETEPQEAPTSATEVTEAAAAPSEEAVPGGSESRDVLLPDIGDFHDVEVIEVLVAAGDRVDEEQSLITLESEKATMEIPSPFAGVVEAVAVDVGAKLNQGDLVARLAVSAAAADGADPIATSVAEAPAASVPPAEPVSTAPEDVERAVGEKEPTRRPVIARPSDAPAGTPHASPAVRRFARELGVDLYLVSGSGPKGRITKDDIQSFVKESLAKVSSTPKPGMAPPSGGLLPAMPEVDFSKFGEIEETELGRIKKISGAHLHRSWLNVPHVTQFDDADITELEAFRKAQKDEAAKQDVKLTFMPFLMLAVSKAMAAYPQFNSSLSPDGERLILKKYVHIGVAVDTPNGLVVPVVRDVDKKGVFDIARELSELSAKARAGKLAPGDMQGGSISISSLGGIGGTQFTPVVNAPEVAILGVSRAQMQPHWNGQEFEPRLMMPFCLSYDHRVIDGAEGVRFTSYLGQLLGDIRRLLL